jgi:hypothetical protein
MVRLDGQQVYGRDFVRRGESIKPIYKALHELEQAGWIRYQTVTVQGQRWPLHEYAVFETPVDPRFRRSAP